MAFTFNADLGSKSPLDPFAAKDVTAQVTDAVWKFKDGSPNSILVNFKALDGEFEGRLFNNWFYLTEASRPFVEQFLHASGFDGNVELPTPVADAKIEKFIGRKLVVDTSIKKESEYQGKKKDAQTKVDRYKRGVTVSADDLM